jgi:hypothetical protein
MNIFNDYTILHNTDARVIANHGSGPISAVLRIRIRDPVVFFTCGYGICIRISGFAMRYLLDPDLLEAQSGFEALPSGDKDHKKN